MGTLEKRQYFWNNHGKIRLMAHAELSRGGQLQIRRVMDTWEGQLQPLTDPSSLTINQFVMVLLRTRSQTRSTFAGDKVNIGWRQGHSRAGVRRRTHGTVLDGLPSGLYTGTDYMFSSALIQVFSKVKFIILDPKVTMGMADVMLIAELGSVVKLTAQCWMGCPVGYIQELSTCLVVHSYRCYPR